MVWRDHLVSETCQGKFAHQNLSDFIFIFEFTINPFNSVGFVLKFFEWDSSRGKKK